MTVGDDTESSDKKFKINLVSATAETNAFLARSVKQEEKDGWRGIERTDFQADLVDAVSVTRGNVSTPVPCP